MYDCSPVSSGDFISDYMLRKLKKQVDFLRKLNIPVIINLLGGEPSLYFDKLKRIVDEISSWNIGITMPTNGWWLEGEISTKKFMNIFEKLVANTGVSSESNGGNGLAIQISDEKYHSAWRKGNNNKKYFDELFMRKEYEHLKPNADDPWIKWQVLDPDYLINPHGRGLGISNLKSFLKKNNTERFCTQEYEGQHLQSIHYELNGHISSVCMFGGEHEGIGTINDNILYIIMLLRYYELYRKKIGKYNCYNCHDIFKSWKKDELGILKEKFSYLNNFNSENFI